MWDQIIKSPQTIKSKIDYCKFLINVNYSYNYETEQDTYIYEIIKKLKVKFN